MRSVIFKQEISIYNIFMLLKIEKLTKFFYILKGFSCMFFFFL